jgi:hypothetical protein
MNFEEFCEKYQLEKNSVEARDKHNIFLAEIENQYLIDQED